MFGKSKKKKSGGKSRNVTPKLTSNPPGGLDAPIILSSKPSTKSNAKKGKKATSFKERWGIYGTGLIFSGIIFALVMGYFAVTLPNIDGLDKIKKQPGITIKTQDGMVLTSYGDVYGEFIEYEDFPESLIHAVLATEDRRFFEHSGIDFWGIARAMVVNVRAGRFVQGGSTITQQVAKNVFLTPDRTLKRKFQEIMLAFMLEARYSKEEIMAIYLNRVYLGAGNYGVDAAARRYFNKSATELKLVESAVLAGLLKAPSKFSPVANPKKAKERAHQVLLNMVDAKYIDQSKVKPALDSFVAPKTYRSDASGSRYFTDWILDELPDYVGAVDQDLVVITTLDPNYQKYAEDAVTKIMDEMGDAKKASQAALVSMDPDGAIRAMVGGRDYHKSQYNRAVQAKRQPGSVFKLFVYLAALDSGMTPDSKVVDQPIEIKVGRKYWRPNNFTKDFRGEITMREGLTHSINSISVQLAMSVGLQRVVSMARRLGIEGVAAAPSIALGSVEATLLDMTGAYAHIANNGRGVQPYGIEAIYDQDGDAIYTRDPDKLWVVLRQRVVHEMNDMLIHVAAEGTGKAANIGRPIAGKTGTSSDHKDAWFIGFTPQLVTGVWVGNDDNMVMNRVTGGNLPALIWRNFMQPAMSNKPVMDIPYGWAWESDVHNETDLPWHGQFAPVENAESQSEHLGAEEGTELPQPTPLLTTPDMPAAEEGQVPMPAPDAAVNSAPTPEQQPFYGEPDPASKVIEFPEDQLPPSEELPPHSIWDKFFDKVQQQVEEPVIEYDYPASSTREKSLER